MFDKSYLGVWDLPAGKGVVFEIERVTGETLTAQGNTKSKKPVIKFVGEDKRLAINKTNGGVIAKMYGNDTRTWVGKRIEIFGTVTQFGRETVDCIRVRPKVPASGASTGGIVAGAEPTQKQLEQRAKLQEAHEGGDQVLASELLAAIDTADEPELAALRPRLEAARPKLNATQTKDIGAAVKARKAFLALLQNEAPEPGSEG